MAALATTTTRLAPGCARTPCALDHLRGFCIDDVAQVGTALLEAHLIVVHGHLLDAQISLQSVVFP